MNLTNLMEFEKEADDEKPFEPGDLIQYAGDKFTVLENRGDRGKVQEYPDGCVVDPFYWDYEGEKCRRALK